MPRENLNGDQLPNVAQKFYSWAGDDGGFKFYDKTEKKNIMVPIGPKQPFTFMVLGVLSTIKGFSDSEGSGFWSNEVLKTDSEPLTVRTKSGVVAVGLLKDIKEKIKAKGAKYCQSVYVATKTSSGYEINNIQLTGAAFSAWLDFVKKNDVYKIAIAVRKSEEGTKGKTVYQIPVFEPVKISEAADNAAVELQKELKEYLALYIAKNASTIPPKETITEQPKKEVNKGEMTKEEFEESVDIEFGGLDEDENAPF